MKQLVFNRILLLSMIEERAKEVVFHPEVTIIKGKNDTGKSSLLKSIYWILGGNPQHLHPKWLEAKPIGKLEFSIDTIDYSLIRWSGQFLLFDGGNKLLNIYKNVEELSLFFKEQFNFNILLSKRGEGAVQAIPDFLFLPFYMDQDKSWIEPWSSFEKLNSFTGWKSDVCHFHTGIRPTEYYELKSEKKIHLNKKNEYVSQKNTLVRTLESLNERLNTVDFDFDLKDYEREIKRLLEEANTLKDEQFKIKSKITKIAEEKHSLFDEIKVLESAEKELKKDYDSTLKLEQSVNCPTCGHDYDNDIVEKFQIVKDEYRCKELLIEVQSELEEVLTKEKNLYEMLKDLTDKESEIRQLLNSKKGEVKLKDIVALEGKKEVKNILIQDIESTVDKYNDELISINDIENKMNAYDLKSERAKDIKEEYFTTMTRFLHLLEVVNLPESSYKKLDSSGIKETGSDLPRALLAYYFALYKVIDKFSTSTFCPIVMDSPKQQDQDLENWQKILGFIDKNKVKSSQLILGLVETGGYDFGGNSKTVLVEEKYHLLQSDEYEKVSKEILPMLDIFMLDSE